MQDEIRQYYHDVVEPTFSAVLTNPGLQHTLSHDRPDTSADSAADSDPNLYGVSFPAFCHAYSLVSTRAFWVDSYHGLAMVPIADA
ncbi:hypothetical protein JVU11DRAFT_6339 [Chiua virens]|nr:hypothetical protein JVU11DRAFT_6339 [Chiua virens]